MTRRLIAHSDKDNKSIMMFIRPDDRDFMSLIEWCENTLSGPYTLLPRIGRICFEKEEDYLMFVLRWS